MISNNSSYLPLPYSNNIHFSSVCDSSFTFGHSLDDDFIASENIAYGQSLEQFLHKPLESVKVPLNIRGECYNLNERITAMITRNQHRQSMGYVAGRCLRIVVLNPLSKKIESVSNTLTTLRQCIPLQKRDLCYLAVNLLKKCKIIS